MRYLTTIAILAAACGAAVPAAAQRFTFFSGNNCRETRLGQFDAARYPGGSHDVTFASGKNDEARSVRIVRGASRGGTLTVYDTPRGRNASKDDYVGISVTTAQLPPQGVCVRSFERVFTAPGVQIVNTHWVNGLDGKVSRMDWSALPNRR